MTQIEPVEARSQVLYGRAAVNTIEVHEILEGELRETSEADFRVATLGSDR